MGATGGREPTPGCRGIQGMPRGQHPGEPGGAQVVVVGGGPAGATTAWALARAGFPVTVVDRAHFPRTKPCAEYLSPQVSRILHAMGVLTKVERAGAAQLAGMRIRATDGTVFEGRFAAAHGYRAFRDRGLSLPRERLDALLLAAARHAGARVLEGWRVTGLRRDAGGRVTGVEGTDASGSRAVLPGALVVGADGLHSVVSRRLGLAHRSRLPRRFAFCAHFRGVLDVGDHGEMHVERDGYVGFADVGGGITNVSLVVPAEVATAARGDAAGFLRRWLRAHAQLAPRFAHATLSSEVLSCGPFASRARRAWAPGAALVGDAADFFDPFTGEGIYSAMRGGELLAPFLAEALRAGTPEAADAALRRYGRALDREFRGKRLVEKLVGFTVSRAPLIDHAAGVLRRRREMADLLVGVAGDFVPAREVLRPRFLLALLGPARA
jgi:flavin-dependent dehydrogenase